MKPQYCNQLKVQPKLILILLLSCILWHKIDAKPKKNKNIHYDYNSIIGSASDYGNNWTTISKMYNNKFIVGGYTNYEYNKRLGAIKCCLQNGKIDTTFNNNGFFQFYINENKGVEIVHILTQNDKKILVLGTTQNKIGNGNSIFLLRLLENGNDDTTFIQKGDTGLVQIQNNGIHPKLDGTESDYYNGFEITNEELLFFKKTNLQIKNAYQPYYELVEEDLITSNLINEAVKLAIQEDGKYIIIGTTHSPYEDAESFVIRLNTNGSLDTTFGNHGRVFLNLTNKVDEVTDITIQPDGKIVVIGNANAEYKSDIASPLKDIFVVRLQTNGNLDTDFNNNGYLIKDVNNEENSAKKVLFLPNNKIMVLGETKGEIANTDSAKNDLLFMQINMDGSFNSNFGNDGIKIINILGYDILEDAQLTSDNKILIAGSQYNMVKDFKNGLLDKKGNPIYTTENTDEEENSYTHQGYLARILLNGNLDSTLYKNGKIFYSSNENFAIDTKINGMLMINDNDIVLIGRKDRTYNSKMLIIKTLITLDIGQISCTKTNQIDYVYPNPIIQETTLKYSLCQESKVSIELYTMTGQKVFTSIENETKNIGSHEDKISIPSYIANGIYILVLATENSKNTIKIVINR